jgi:hypothetical protein
LRDAIAAKGATEGVLLNADAVASFGALVNPDVRAETRDTLSLSRVFVTPSGLDALVVYSHSCGNVCGAGGAIWLRRASTNSAWLVAARRIFWQS